MFKIFNKGESEPQKKLITFRNAELIDGMIKAEAVNQNSSESLVVEKTLTEHYLNSNDAIASAVATNLFNENGIVLALKAITQIYITHPEYANDSLIHVLEYAARSAQNYRVSLKTDSPGVKELAVLALDMEKIITKTVNAIPGYQFLSADGKSSRHVDTISLTELHDVTEAATVQRKLDLENILFFGINSIINFWNFGGDEHSVTLKNWKGTYLFLKQILNLSVWDDYPADKFEFSQLAKNITLDNGDKGVYTSNTPVLSQNIYLKKKCFITTEDAVILRSEATKNISYYTDAYRIIHGPGMPMTKKPYIILCRNESDSELENIVEELLKKYPEEFPDPHDSYLIQFMWNGAYYDDRIRWKTV